ncbi:RNA-directed DNA polymerase, eukaryota, reverse transcriptase zinc-binding domain protein, partial [Tanacetum coccineum]
GVSLWVRVVMSIHGDCGGLGDVRALGRGVTRGGVSGDILKIGEESEGFLRLYHFDMRKEVNVLERGVWVDNSWVWEWDSVRDIRGKVSKELEDLLVHGQRTFKVKELSDNGDQETLWNKLVPKKVNKFIWRALRGRLPVRVELDKRGVDLDPVLCPSCNNVVETCAHCLITCDLAMSVWDKIFKWWKVRIVNVFTIDEFFSYNGNVNVPPIFSFLASSFVDNRVLHLERKKCTCVRFETASDTIQNIEYGL